MRLEHDEEKLPIAVAMLLMAASFTIAFCSDGDQRARFENDLLPARPSMASHHAGLSIAHAAVADAGPQYCHHLSKTELIGTSSTSTV